MRLAHAMALASPHVTADMVDASTFQQLSAKYRVSGVPVSYFNGRLTQLGAAPEERVADLIRQAENLAG